MNWEYDVIGLDVAELNRLGKQGWEAVGTMTDLQRDGYGNQYTVSLVLLKRQSRRD